MLQPPARARAAQAWQLRSAHLECSGVDGSVEGECAAAAVTRHACTRPTDKQSQDHQHCLYGKWLPCLLPKVCCRSDVAPAQSSPSANSATAPATHRRSCGCRRCAGTLWPASALHSAPACPLPPARAPLLPPRRLPAASGSYSAGAQGLGVRRNGFRSSRARLPLASRPLALRHPPCIRMVTSLAHPPESLPLPCSCCCLLTSAEQSGSCCCFLRFFLPAAAGSPAPPVVSRAAAA